MMKLLTTNQNKDQYLINGIASGNTEVINEVYMKYSNTVQKFIMNAHGSIEDAKDVFQESIIIIYSLSKKKEIILTCSFITYFMTICKRVWWKRIQKENRLQVDTLNSNLQITQSFPDSYQDEENEKYQLYQEKLQSMKPKKRQILELYSEGKKMEDITRIMGLKNESYARKFKYKCKVQLQKLVQADTRFIELA